MIIRITDLLKHLMIKIRERNLTQRFDDSMSSFSSEKRIKLGNLILSLIFITTCLMTIDILIIIV